MDTSNQRNAPWTPFLMGVLAVLCGPSGFFGLLWLVYQIYDAETKTSYSQPFAILLFFFYLIVSGFGVYILFIASIFWCVIVSSAAPVRIRVIATVLMALAVVGTFKAAWVIGFRH
ncbi:MAG TPA: hypothetical protein VK722_07255 [Candidatus Aquilonibacter sp.]|nr:hypothetical protein [Candidatus Aquilonibacter sp.]